MTNLNRCKVCGSLEGSCSDAKIAAASCQYYTHRLQVMDILVNPQDHAVDDEFSRRARQLERMLALAEHQVRKTFEKDKEYASSWRQRLGVGAYFTIVRKWDRIENAAKATTFRDKPVHPYDLFQRFELDRREEGIQDDVMDLVGYLLVLVEHMMELGYVRDILLKSKEVRSSGGDMPIRISPLLTGTSVGAEDDVVLRNGRVDHPAPYGFTGEEEG